MKTYLLLN